MNDPIKTSAKDFFLYLGMIAALYVSAISLLTVMFQAINAAFPDMLLYNTGANASAVRVAVSALIVSFPLYIILSRFVYQDLKTSPLKRELWIRRWLIYLTLFLAGVTLAVNVVVLVNTFLEGELTGRFLLKVVAVGIVASAIFRYYLYDLKRDIKKTESQVRTIARAVTAVTIVSLVGGVMIAGTPGNQRLVRFDERRISDLSSMQWQIVNYWQAKGSLPTTVDQLTDPLNGYSVPLDPTGVPYEYRSTGSNTFELCATFALATNAAGSEGSMAYPTYPESGITENWQHSAGRNCFERTIDPEFYPPRTSDSAPIPTKPVPVMR